MNNAKKKEYVGGTYIAQGAQNDYVFQIYQKMKKFFVLLY